VSIVWSGLFMLVWVDKLIRANKASIIPLI